VSGYLLVNLLVVAGPLALSFDRRVHFYTRWPAVFVAIAAVGAAYVAWDALFAARGHWAFNPAHVGRIRLFGLPLEEVLFFVTVPYACLFTYEVVRAYAPPAAGPLPPAAFAALAAAFAAAALAFRKRPYTALAMLACAAFLVAALLAGRDLLAGSHFWLYIAITYAPFVAANGVLTALPVVTYSPRAILGPRVLTIPVEDFFYSFSMLGFEALVYRLAEARL
jgi:lycopene cyclase domain-containing protein